MKSKILIGLLTLYSGISTINSCQKNTRIQELEKICSEKSLVKKFEAGTKKYKNQEINYLIINPKEYNFKIKEKENGIEFNEVKEENLFACINGSFFDENYSPLGRVISEGEIKNSNILKKNWGYFSLDKNNNPSIDKGKHFNNKKENNFVIQGYPILVKNGEIMTKKDYQNKHSRTIIGINNSDNLVFVSTEKSLFGGFTLNEIAKLMYNSKEEGGFDCKDALNLDGGSSCKMYVKDKIKDVSGAKISNYIAIYKK